VVRCHAHGGTEFSIDSCIPSKYMNQRKPLGSFFHQKSLPYRPNHFSLTMHLGSHGLGPWVTKKIHVLLIFNGFFARNLNIHLGFLICQSRSSSQGFKRTHQGPRALIFILLHILWPDRDPCCMFSSLTKSKSSSSSSSSFFFLFFFILSFSFFLGLHGLS